MKINIPLGISYSIIMLITSIDIAVLSGLIWVSIRDINSPMLLGMVIFFSIMVPVLIKSSFRKYHIDITTEIYTIIKLVFLAIVFAISFFVETLSLYYIFYISLMMGSVNFINQIIAENENISINNKFNLKGESASKYIQLSIQLGNFIGALSGGVLIEVMDLNFFLNILILASFVSTFGIFLFLKKHKKNDGYNFIKVAASSSRIYSAAGKLFYLFPLLIGVHVGAFNSLIPILFNQEYQWSGGVYGLASALVCLGAIISVRISLQRNMTILLGIILVVTDTLLMTRPVYIVAMLSCLSIGITVNYCRIYIRQQILDSNMDKNNMSFHIQKQLIVFAISSALSSLFISMVVVFFANGITVSRVLFVVIAIITLLYISSNNNDIQVKRKNYDF